LLDQGGAISGGFLKRTEEKRKDMTFLQKEKATQGHHLASKKSAGNKKTQHGRGVRGGNALGLDVGIPRCPMSNSTGRKKKNHRANQQEKEWRKKLPLREQNDGAVPSWDIHCRPSYYVSGRETTEANGKKRYVEKKPGASSPKWPGTAGRENRSKGKGEGGSPLGKGRRTSVLSDSIEVRGSGQSLKTDLLTILRSAE